jgi:hypothetical protein
VTHCKPLVHLSRGSGAARPESGYSVWFHRRALRVLRIIVRQLRAQSRVPATPTQKPPSDRTYNRPPSRYSTATPTYALRRWISRDRRKVLAADRMKIYLFLFQDTFGTSPIYIMTWITQPPAITHKVSIMSIYYNNIYIRRVLYCYNKYLRFNRTVSYS